jgi:hypothetical protein
VSWFRKERTLNEVLRERLEVEEQREEGAPLDGPTLEPPAGPYFPQPASNRPLTYSPRGGPPDFHALVTLDLPELAGDAAVFVVLPDGDLLVEQEEGDTPLARVADELEKQIRPPYRASGSRQEGAIWGFVARRIEVAEVPGALDDEVTLALVGGEETLERGTDPGPWHELAAEKGFESYVVEAERLDGDLFEVSVTPL